MRTVTVLIIVLGLIALPVVAAAPLAAPAQAESATPDLSGLWQLNYDLSDDPQGNVPGAVGEGPRRRPGGGFGVGGPGGGFGGRGGGFGGRGGGWGRPEGDEANRPRGERRAEMREALADLMTAPRQMTIAQREREIALRYDDGRAVRLIPDNREHAGIAGSGVEVTRKTRWEAGTLVAEIRLESGFKLTHVLEPRLEGAQLVVTTTIAPRGDFDGQEVRRVYNRGSAN